ncbi:MAG: hypothetical protein CMJ46_03550 [Planctomyces sp.]|nr:hypothetical protein [Planctomyces sp.]
MRKFLYIAGAALVLYFAGVTFMAMQFFPSTNVADLGTAPFEITSWSAGGEARQPVLYDVIENVITEGMSRDEVIKRLGHPDRPSAHRLEYDVGLTPEAFDSAFLVIELDGGGSVSGTRLLEN